MLHAENITKQYRRREGNFWPWIASACTSSPASLLASWARAGREEHLAADPRLPHSPFLREGVAGGAFGL